LQSGHQLLDLGFHPRDALPGEQVHTGRALELRQFPWRASNRWCRAATSAASSPAAGGAWSGGGG
jgi:hypothetical protein